MATTSNPVQLTAKSKLPSWLKSPATINSGDIRAPVRWLAHADGRNAPTRTKQAKVEKYIRFIVFLSTFTEPQSDQSGDASQYLRSYQLDLHLQKEPRPRSVGSHCR